MPTQSESARSGYRASWRDTFAPFIAIAVLVLLFVSAAWIAFQFARGVCWFLAEIYDHIGAIGWAAVIPVLILLAYEIHKGHAELHSLARSEPKSTRSRLWTILAAAIVISGNLCLNIAASRIDKFWQERRQYTTEIYINHDLANLVGQCIRLAMLRYAGNVDTSAERKALTQLANDAPDRWFALVLANDSRAAALGDAKLTEFIREPKSKALHEYQWRELLVDWCTKSNQNKLKETTIAATAQTIAADFGITLREALKADFELGGKAWAAMQLDIARQLLGRTPASLGTGNPEIVDALIQVKEMLADDARGLPALHAIILDVKQSQEAHAREVAANFDALVTKLAQIEKKLDTVVKDIDRVNDQIKVVIQELGVKKRIMGAMLRELDNGILIVDFDPSSKASDGEVFQAILLLTEPRVVSKDIAPRRIELTPEVREFVIRMAHNASVIDKHRAAVALGQLDLADILAEQYEKERNEQRDAEDYAFFVTRGDRFLAGQNYELAKLNYGRAMAFRVDEPTVVYRAAMTATLAPGKATYTRDVQRAQSWVEQAIVKIAVKRESPSIDTARLQAILAVTLYQQGKSGESVVPACEALRLLALNKYAPFDQSYGILVDAADALKYAGKLPEAAAAADRAVDSAEHAEGRDSDAVALALASRARIRQYRGDLKGAEEDIEKSIEWGEAQAPRLNRSLAIWYASRAHVRQNLGDVSGALEDINASITWFESQIPRDERIIAIDCAARASIRVDGGDLMGAEVDIRNSIDWFEAQTPRNERELAINYATRAIIRMDRDLEGADTDIQNSINWEQDQAQPNMCELAIRYATRARIRKARRDLEGAEEDIRTSIDWLESQSPPDRHSLAINLAWRATIRQTRNNPQGAEEDITKSITLEKLCIPRNERSLAIRYAMRAIFRKERGDLEGAEEDIASSIELGKAQSPRDSHSLAIHYASRASIRMARGNLDGAEGDITQSISLAEVHIPRDQRGLTIWYALRARIRQNSCNHAGAEADIQKSIDCGEGLTPRDQRSLENLYASRARIRQNRGNPHGAEEDITRCINWGEAQSPRDDRRLALDYASRASIRYDCGDVGEAEADIEESINWEEAQTPHNERSLATAYATRARIEREKSDFKKALADIEWSIAWAKRQTQVDEWVVADWRGDRATILAELNQLDKARDDIAHCIAWYKVNKPGCSERIAQFLRDRALILAHSGKWPEAAANIAEALSLYERVLGRDHEWTKKARAWQATIELREIPPRWSGMKL